MRRDAAYWRSLEERLGGAAFHEAARPEFPAGADHAPDGMSRRRFMQLLGASMALAGVSGCVEMPEHRIVPYAVRPPEMVPGVPLSYATTMALDGYGVGLLVQAREGRPIKIEGNPAHPASLGAAGVYEQASLLGLYDPARAQGIRRGAAARDWRSVVAAFDPNAVGPSAGRTDRGERLRFLMRPTASPFRKRLVDLVRERYPLARFHFHSPVPAHAGFDATRAAFGKPLATHYDFRRAAVVAAFDADFLARGAFHHRHARDFAASRRIEKPGDDLNRLYVAEPYPTPTGSLADHRLRVRAAEVWPLLLTLAARLRVGTDGLAVPRLSERADAWIDAAAADLRAAAPAALVLAGDDQPAIAHALAHRINERLGAAGETTWHTEPAVLDAGTAAHDLRELAAELRAGAVDTLVVLEANPAYTAPGELAFGTLLERVETVLYLGPYDDETAAAADWFIPSAHYLESWGDAAAHDGTLSLVQPLIAPLNNGRTPDELLAVFAGRTGAALHDLLQAFWRTDIAPAAPAYDGAFDAFWERTLHDGLVAGTAAPRVTPAAAASLPPPPRRAAVDAGRASTLEVAFRADPSVYDGRFANNGWLLELPDPTTKLTWGNAALLSPASMARRGLSQNDVVRVTLRGRSVELPAFPVPGQADETLVLHLGYGRRVKGATGDGVGADVYALRPADALSVATGATLERVLAPDGTPRRQPLISTQTHWSMEGRDIVLERSIGDYRADPAFTAEHRGEVPSLYPGPRLTSDYQWGMTIDLSICTGCSACVVACQAENNIPIVGPDGVQNGREMHWLRIDRYMTGTPEEPHVVHQPMLCQQCEHAPCEYVCPVNATVHSDDGLNEMIYNRCVGTRFCSNNCPYKVRRFNWFDFNAPRRGTELLVLNPDVTVRERGVMEKCTYCVQRIRRAQIRAREEGRFLEDGEVVTACQQACPTRAIVFGNLVDPDSEVAKTREQERRYEVLHELGVMPRTQYLARIGNPNPTLARREQAAGERASATSPERAAGA